MQRKSVTTGDLSETAVQGHNQKGERVLELFGERGSREETHVSRSCHSVTRWEFSVQRAPQDSSSLESFIAPRFVLSMASRH